MRRQRRQIAEYLRLLLPKEVVRVLQMIEQTRLLRSSPTRLHLTSSPSKAADRMAAHPAMCNTFLLLEGGDTFGDIPSGDIQCTNIPCMIQDR